MNKSDVKPTIQDIFLDQPYTLSGRVIDPVLGTLLWQGKLEHLRRKELEVLALLASVNGAIVARNDFIELIWNDNALVGDHALSNAISSLRQALCDNDSQRGQPLIRTIPRRGYQLSEAAQQVPAVSDIAPAEIASRAAHAVFAPGQSVPHSPGWRLLRQLGASPLSESWLADPSEYSAELDHSAPRVFRFCRSEAYLRRLQREVTLLRYVNQSLAVHSGFAVIRDWQLDEPPYYLARDYAKYGNLIEWRQASVTPKTPALDSMAQVCEALAALHQLGVVHRNLSAARILVDETDAGPQLKISALSLGVLSDRSKLAPLQITAAGLTIGADEASELASAADDIAALGLIFLQWTLGDWQAAPTESALAQVGNADVQALLRRCLGKANARPSAIELARQLRTLLAPDASAQPPESAAQSVPLAASTPHASPLAAPETIGNYRLLDRLGEGGMGTVYLAAQRDPYRKVALKIIRSGLDGKQILSRFDAERQALAMMNHPNVAYVHDSGLAADGRPFFAMEYIAGHDITTYCDAHHLNIPARIKLFLQVCDGVLHAHQKGVLHRDIKPSNLMVSSAPESAGAVKVIDFGLAKSLHGKLAAHTLHTSFGAFIGTPIYSSPEHVSGAASGVDTRSDIYSMGVVLYELLAGSTPISNESLENLEAEKVREIVCKSKLPTMREQLQNASAAKRKEVAECRAIKADELPKTLDGDLSWVVGKCLQRDANDRYASVLELRRDLERWLQFRPVEAKPTTAWYRFAKLVRRNRGTFFLIAASVATLLLTSTAAFIGFVRANQARQEADQVAQFQSMQLESMDPAAMGERLRQDLVQAFSAQGPIEQAQSDKLLAGLNFTDISLNQLDSSLLDPTLLAIRKNFSANPAQQSRLAQALANTWSALGRFDKALSAQKWALELKTQAFGANDVSTINAMAKLADIKFSSEMLEESEQDYRRAITLMHKYVDDRDPIRPQVANRFGNLLVRLGKFEEAESVFRENLAHQRQFFPVDDVETLESINSLGGLMIDRKQLDEAIALISEALAKRQQLLGPDHADTLNSMNDLSLALVAQKRFADAEPYAKRALSGYQKRFGDEHPVTTMLKAHLGRLVFSQGRLDGAEALSNSVLDTRLATMGEGHPATFRQQVFVSVVRASQGKYAQVERDMRAILGKKPAAAPTPPYLLNLARFTLANALQRQGENAEAQALCQMLQADTTSTEPPDQIVRFQSQSLYALMLPPDQAEVLQRQAYDGLLKLAGEKESVTLVAQGRLIDALRLGDKIEAAKQLSGQLMKTVRKSYPAGHYIIASYLTINGRVLAADRQFAEAEKNYNEAWQLLKATVSADKALTNDLAGALVDLYTQWKKMDGAGDFSKKIKFWMGKTDAKNTLN